MAEAVLSIVLEQLASIVLVQVKKEVKLVFGVTEDVEHLTKSLTVVQAVLADAETKQVASEAVKLWLQDLKHIMYDAEDVLDEWGTRIATSQSQSSGVVTIGVQKKARSYLSSLCSCFQPIIERHVIGHRILDLRERLDKNGESVSQLKLIKNLTKDDHHQRRDFTSSISNVSEINGRDSDKRDIVGKLFSETSNSTQTPVISIVGMGGLGKSTLAQLIYKDEKVTETFEIQMWVCVSELFDRERIAREIIQQATDRKPDVTGWESLHQQMSKAVQGKQFLLLLDDVWSEDYSDWAPLKNSLNGGAKGSRIIVTTRSNKVAKMMDSIYTHELKQLSDEDCWSLFQRIAFRGRSQDEAESLEEIGRELANKCKGIPLAAETLASRMQFANTKDEWRHVSKSELWEVRSEDAKGFFPALLLSYQALDPQSKQCFMYTAIFPEDAEIEKDMLVKLWMAQGYLGLDGTKELEIIGARCFDDLAMRSFFQKEGSRTWREGDFWKMHDLVREFAQFLAKTEFSLGNNGFSSDKVRHIRANSLLENSDICEESKVRTFVSRSFLMSNPNFSELFQLLKCLRVLELSNSGIEEVPDEVGTLSHLRYLDLSENEDLEVLPETVCNLYNLQTLILDGCRCLSKLPDGVGRLSNLRHLELDRTSDLKCLPKSIGELSRLRTLRRFTVSEEVTIGELERLNHLRGSLMIDGLDLVKNEEEAKRAQLVKKKNLHSLHLYGDNADDAERAERILEGLQPNTNLESLLIFGYTGLSIPLWMFTCDSVLPNIVTLKLSKFKNCRQLPHALGKLKHLQSLSLMMLPLVKDLSAQLLGVSYSGGNGASSSSEIVLFPKLRKLEIWELEGWEEEIEKSISSTSIMPCLQELRIEYCPKLKVVPHYMTSSSSSSKPLNIEISSCPHIKSLILQGNTNARIYNGEYVYMSGSAMSSIDSFFSRKEALQLLKIENCEILELNPKRDLGIFYNLQEVNIYNCPKVECRCSIEDWGTKFSNLPYKITINDQEIIKGTGYSHRPKAPDCPVM